MPTQCVSQAGGKSCRPISFPPCPAWVCTASGSRREIRARRSYGLEHFQQAPTGWVESSQLRNKPETCRDRKHKSSRRLVSFEVSQLSQANGNRARWVALVLLALSVLLNLAWADVGGRITGVVTDPSSAFISGATVTLTNTNNGTKQAATTNEEGQYSFPAVRVGEYELEISAP